MKTLALAGVLAASGGAALACNPELAPPLLPTDPEFQSAAAAFTAKDTNKYARIAAYETMLRVEGAAFGAVLRDGYLSDDTDIIGAATYCDVMRSNGAVARVTGLPEGGDSMTEQQKAQIRSISYAMAKADADWSQGCFSTRDHRGEGCDPAFFISVRNGVVTFRSDMQTGSFRRVDGEFIGTIELVYGGPVYTVPAKLTLQ